MNFFNPELAGNDVSGFGAFTGLQYTVPDLDGKKIGIISDPEIVTKKINENSKFIVIGSDGLWDVIQPYDVSRIARTYFNKGDIDGACKNLLKKAKPMRQKKMK